MTDPKREIDKLVKHRRYRERKVVAALRATGGGRIRDLVPHAYDDVDPALHKMASYSLWAHLIKLERDGLAECNGAGRANASDEQRWRLY